jgi:ADP-ribosyl-[dinitrogen reductase] hydrolase
VPPALVCALDATSYEDFIRAGVSIGGDTDTICAIGGAVAEALFGVPEEIASQALKRLDDNQLGIVGRFKEKFG